MSKAVPILLFKVCEQWFNMCLICVRFGSSVTSFVSHECSLECGVRQGSDKMRVSPHLLNIYVDDAIKTVPNSNYAITYVSYAQAYLCMQMT